MRKLLWIFLLACSLAHGRTALPDLTGEQWRQDLAYFADQIGTQHRDPWHFISKAGFDRAVDDLRARVPSMQGYEVVVGLQHLAALVGDGHTFVDTSGLYRKFPLQVFWFGDELRVVRAAAGRRAAMDSAATSLGDGQNLRRVCRLRGHESGYSMRGRRGPRKSWFW